MHFVSGCKHSQRMMEKGRITIWHFYNQVSSLSKLILLPSTHAINVELLLGILKAISPKLPGCKLA